MALAAALLVTSGWQTAPGAAAAEPPAEPNETVVLFQSFEDDDTGGWNNGWSNGGTVAISSEYASDGEKSLHFKDRTSRGHSPFLDLTNIMQSERIYHLSLKVRLGSGSDTLHIASKVDSPLLENKYPWMIGNQTVDDTAWTTFEVRDYEVPANTVELVIYVESDNASTSTADIYIDEVLIIDVTPDGGNGPGEEEPDLTGIFSDFEDGIGNWVIRNTEGGASVAVTDEDNYTADGAYSLKTTVSTQYNGPILNVMGKMSRGHQYRLSAWVKMAEGSAPTSLRISVQSGDSTFTNVSPNVTVTDGQWAQLTGNFTLAVRPSVLQAYVETAQTPAAPVSFYMDDFELAYIGPVAGPKPIQNLTPIKDVYADYFLIGNAVGDADFDGYRLDLLKRHHNVVTAENAMKPDYAYNSNREFDFAAEDALMAKIEEHELLLHGHVLVWHQQSPLWLSTGADNTPLDRAEALANMRSHIETVMEYFGERTISWDVVNEAISDNPPNPADWRASLRNSPWKAAIGDDYVEQAFLIAKEVIKGHGWDIKLYYNDYNEDNQNKATAIANMVEEINARYAEANDGELLIDGIGMQAHYNLNTRPDNVEASLQRFIALGVEVSITELDITAGSNFVLTEAEAKAQGYLYAQLMKLFKQYADHIARVTFWGSNDASSWRDSQNPLLFDGELQAKPAYYAVIDPDTFIEQNPPDTVQVNQSTAGYGTPVIDGQIDAIWSTTVDIPITKYQSAWHGAHGVAKALWDDSHLYVLFQVNNEELDKSSVNPWEQDSVEVFLDQNNGKTTSYQPDDGQYRVNYDNETSFNPPSIAEGFESATRIDGTNYTVEVKIPLSSITPANDTLLGFDVQINDGKAGSRQSIAVWNDMSGQGYQDTSVFGVLKLIGRSSSGGFVMPPPADNTVEKKDGVVSIKPEVRTINGRSVGTITPDGLKKALELADAAADGRKRVVVELPKQTDAATYEVRLPADSLSGRDAFDLEWRTEHAALLLPGHMLANANLGGAEQVSIRVSGASLDALDAADREQIGDRPVIQLNVAAGDRVMAWNNPEAPVTVAIPYTPTAAELQHPDRIVVWYIDGQGKPTPVKNGRYDAATQSVVFQTTHFSTYAVAFSSRSFGDLQGVPWAVQAVEAMAARDIIRGTSGNSFSPASSITRADFIALLVRALELQGAGGAAAMFGDVPANAYYYEELAIAKELGIAAGVGDNRFNPGAPISRQDVMTLTSRALAAAGKPLRAGSGAAIAGFADSAALADYARSSAAALVEAGIIQGKNGGLAPKASLTRAEAAVILYRIWKLQ